MGVTPPHLRTSYNLFFIDEELENDGCECEFIVGHFENGICMCSQVRFESRFGSTYSFKYFLNINSTCIN